MWVECDKYSEKYKKYYERSRKGKYSSIWIRKDFIAAVFEQDLERWRKIAV